MEGIPMLILSVGGIILMLFCRTDCKADWCEYKIAN